MGGGKVKTCRIKISDVKNLWGGIGECAVSVGVGVRVGVRVGHGQGENKVSDNEGKEQKEHETTSLHVVAAKEG